MTKLKPDDLEYCPSEKDSHTHCNCWWDGDGCCRCDAPAMTKEQMIEQGMIEEQPYTDETLQKLSEKIDGE